MSCIICSQTDSDESLLTKSCKNPECDAEAHKQCLVSDYKLEILQCKKCNHDNDTTQFFKFNLWGFITIPCILAYRALCFVSIPIIFIVMTLGKDLSYVADCNYPTDSNSNCEVARLILMMSIVITTGLFIGSWA